MEEYRAYIKQHHKQQMAGTLLFVALIFSAFILGSSVSAIEKNQNYDVVTHADTSNW